MVSLSRRSWPIAAPIAALAPGGAFARGEWLQSDGSRYTGAFAGGKPSGDGEFFSVSSGNSTKGFFDATGAWTTTEVA